MLQKLRALFRRRPRLDDADPAVRRRALEEVDDQTVLARVFADDADPALKREALARISDLAFLETCLNEDDFLGWPLKNEIIARIGEVAPPNAMIRQHPLLIAATIANADDVEAAADALALFENPNDLAQAVLGHPRVQLRKAMAETIWNPDRLRVLENRSRGHDKAVNRIAKTRLTLLKEAQAQARDYEAVYQTADASARALDTDDPHYTSKRQSIETNLAALIERARACNERLTQFGEDGLPIDAWQASFPPRHEIPPEVDLAVAEGSDAINEILPHEVGGSAHVAANEAADGPTDQLAGEPAVAPADELAVLADEPVDEQAAADLEALANEVDALTDPSGDELDEFARRLGSCQRDGELSERIDKALGAFRRSVELAPEAKLLLGHDPATVADAPTDTPAAPDASSMRDNDVSTEVAAEEPTLSEPAQAKSTRSEPTQSEPTQSEPTQSEPAQSEPTQSELAQSEPAQSEPTQSEPTQSEPAQSEPAQSEPAQSEPAQSEPAQGEPTQGERTQSEPAQGEPTQSGPAQSEPTQSEPTQSEPTLGDRLAATRARTKRATKLIRRYAWPSNLATPALLTELEAFLGTEQEARAALEAEAETLVKRTETDLDALDQTLEEGNVQQASRIEHRLRDAVSALPGGAARPLSSRLNDASARLRRLRDWRDFAVGPKRLELIESMEALPDEPDDVQAQADTVKSLRRAWNELGPLKGRDRELKDRFDAAAERAFEACRKHYRDLAEQRQRNLAERRSIVGLLDDYIAGPHWRDSDCRDIERVLRTARSEWRRFHPVDRQAGRDVERAFNAATETIYETLKSHWAKNETAKQNIIDRAESIAESTDRVDERTRAIVDLQAEWKNAGALPRHRDQKLYTRFRVHCDAVFEDRTNLRAERDANFKASETLVNDLAERIRASAAAEPVDEAAIRALRKEAQEIDHLPRKLRATLDALFDQADAAMIAAHLEEERREQAILVDTIRAIDAELVPSLGDWEDRAGKHADWFRPRIDGEPNDEDVRTLVIEAEIAAEIESPDADRQLRLSVQVERLNFELGRIDRKPADPKDLLARWCGAPVSDDEALRGRFFDAVEKLVATD